MGIDRKYRIDPDPGFIGDFCLHEKTESIEKLTP